MEESRLLINLYVFSLTAALSAALTPLMKRLARRWGVLDMPAPRKVHQAPVPLLGGAAVAIAFLLAVGGHYLFFVGLGPIPHLFSDFLSGQYERALALRWHVGIILGTALAVFLVGVADDVMGTDFDYRWKFAVQFAAAVIVAERGIQVGIFSFAWVNKLLTVLWIVGITNAFNLLDNMDGLSSGVAMLSASIFFIVASRQGQFFMALILAALLGAVAGFYPYNFPKARIFLGDGGSLFVGYLLGVLTVAESYVTALTPSLFPVALPLLVLALPLFDTFSVIYIRWREKRPLFVGDKRHLSHRLVALGMTKRQAVMAVYLFSLVMGVNALLLEQLSHYGGWILLFQGALVIILICVLMTAGAKGKTK